MSTIVINSKSYVGNNLVMRNNRIFIDGKEVTEDGKEINIIVQGNLNELTVDACNKVSIEGSSNNVKTQSGDVEVAGEVKGNVQTMSGDVKCGKVGGSVSTMSGDVTHK